MLSIDEYTMKNILAEYAGTCMYIALFCAALVYIFIKNRRADDKLPKDGSMVFVWYTLAFALTVFNPLIVAPLLERVEALTTVYYRLFWALPVVGAIGYVCTRMILSVSKKAVRAAVAAVLVFVIVLCGTPVFEVGLQRAENPYKVPENLIHIITTIREDAQEQPITIFPNEYADRVRLYDPSVWLAFGRSAFLGNPTSADNEYNEKANYVCKTVYYTPDGAAADELRAALDYLEVDYIVLPPEASSGPLLQTVGYFFMEDAEGYTIYVNAA